MLCCVGCVGGSRGGTAVRQQSRVCHDTILLVLRNAALIFGRRDTRPRKKRRAARTILFLSTTG